MSKRGTLLEVIVTRMRWPVLKIWLVDQQSTLISPIWLGVSGSGFSRLFAVAQALHALDDEHADVVGIDIAKADGEVGIGGAGEIVPDDGWAWGID